METRDRALAMTGCCVALAALVPVALYQSGLLKHLPDPPGNVFASEEITSSKIAHPLGIPDSYPGLGSYSTTLALLIFSRKSRTARRLLGAKLIADAGLATFNMVRQVVTFRKLCSWCTATALATAPVVYGGREAIAETLREVQQAL